MIDPILLTIKSGTDGVAYIDPDKGKELATAGLVELNASMVDDFGGIAARLTPSGLWAVENDGQPAKLDEPIAKPKKAAKVAAEPKETDMATAPTDTFEITKGGFEAPARKQIERNNKYPFDSLEVGDSFLVPAKTVEKFASTVTAANRKYSEETGETENYTRKGETKTRPVRKSLRKFAYKAEGDGVRVGRVA